MRLWRLWNGGTVAEWPDPEDTVGHALNGLTEHEVVSTLAGVHSPTGEDWRNLPAEAMPIIRTTVLGGVDNQVTDIPRVEVVVYAATRREARRLAEQARTRLAPGRLWTPFGVIDQVETEMRPYEQQSADPTRVRRWRAVYRVSSRHRWSQ